MGQPRPRCNLQPATPQPKGFKDLYSVGTIAVLLPSVPVLGERPRCPWRRHSSRAPRPWYPATLARFSTDTRPAWVLFRDHFRAGQRPASQWVCFPIPGSRVAPSWGANGQRFCINWGKERKRSHGLHSLRGTAYGGKRRKHVLHVHVTRDVGMIARSWKMRLFCSFLFSCLETSRR